MIEPINFLGALRQRWRLFVVLAVVGAVIALLAPISSPKHSKSVLKYETFATVGAPSSSGLLQGSITAPQILFFANTFPVKLAAVADVGLVGNPYQYVFGMLGVSGSPAGKGAYPTSAPVAGSAASGKAASAAGVVTLYASAQTPTLAADLANAYAKELGNTLEQAATTRAAAAAAATGKGASSSSSSTSSTGSSTPVATGFTVLFPGTVEGAKRINAPKASQLNSHKVRLVLGVLGGLALALLITLGREVLNKTVRSPGRAEVHFKFPVVAEIPETYPPDPTVVDVVDRPTSPAAEAYRKLRMSVLFESMAAESSAASGADPFAEMFGVSSAQVEPYRVPEPGSRSVVLVVSSGDEPSRPKVVANLAATFAEASERVIVISTADLESGGAVPAESVLTGPITADDVERRLMPAGPDNVAMLSMRHFLRNSGQLVSRATDVLDAAREAADVVVVEAPAFLRFHHGEALVHSVDAVIVVAESGTTEVGDARDVGGVLRRLGAPVLGVVFTGGTLPNSQRKLLVVSVTAAERRRAALTSGAVEDDEPPAAGGPDRDPVSGTAPELHPS